MAATPTPTSTSSPKVDELAAMMETMPMIEIPDEQDKRNCVLSFEQVKRLDALMSERIAIHGRGNFPTIDVKLCDLISKVKKHLEADGVKVHKDGVRLNGSGASSVLASNDVAYNDLDLIFCVELATGRAYDRVKCAVLESLIDLLPEGVSTTRMSTCSMKEAYVSKMVKVNDSPDRWSLITLGNNRAQSVELKFVHAMRRQYEFSVDSFHIRLDSLFQYYEWRTGGMEISDNFYPNVVAESMYGNYGEALDHLHRKLIATDTPEEIRGGGLLKYCNLLCHGYRAADPEAVHKQEPYMCNRFFIDFPGIATQQSKLENYLFNHFHSSEDRLKHEYLMILYHVIDESPVCLMPQERRATLSLIEEMAYNIYCPPQPEPQVCAASSFSSAAASSYSGTNSSNSSTCGSLEDPNLLSPMSMSDSASTISSASSTASSSTSASSSASSSTRKHKKNRNRQRQNQNNNNYRYHAAAPVVSANTNLNVATLMSTPPPNMTSLPPPSHHPASSAAGVATPSNLIPTYEIVTSCQPAVVYSDGYYYTSFVTPSGESGTVTSMATSMTSPVDTSCITCATCNQWMAHQSVEESNLNVS